LYLIQNTGEQGQTLLHKAALFYISIQCNVYWKLLCVWHNKVKCECVLVCVCACARACACVCVCVSMRFCMHMYIHTSIGKCMKFKIFFSHWFRVFYNPSLWKQKGLLRAIMGMLPLTSSKWNNFHKVYPKITSLGGYSLIIHSNIAHKKYHH
jgi:hypothetical protein